MKSNELKILAIDDNGDNLTALKAIVADRMPGARLLSALNGPQGLELARAQDPDVILLDIVMPAMDGYAVCRKLKEDHDLQAIPVIFLTALRADRDSRIKALETGAEGFLSKPFDEVELIAQIRAMAKIKAANRLLQMEKEQLSALVAERTRKLEKELAERKRAEQALRESEDRFKYVFESANVGKSITRPTGEMDINKAFADLLGYTKAELRGITWQELTPADEITTVGRILDSLLKGEKDSARMTKRYIHKNGTIIWADVSLTIRRNGEGQPLYFIATMVDITDRMRADEEREKLQAQLVQAQKMESVGRLAGGVAHDFNNMLSVILGHTEIALEEVDPTLQLYADLKEIRNAAKRSADLTRQLLAFARKQTIAPRVLDLNETVDGMLRMLGRLIGEDIDLAWLPKPGVWPLKVDPSQIDQILANLCVNARDAITGVGKVTIETANAVIDDDYCADHPGFIPGEYILLAVSDDGCGMDKATLGKLFEPFFTTKAVGRGTGLGLAMVYGIVKQNNGFINVYSEPGKGTTFKIYLPRHADEAGQLRKQSPTAPSQRGYETILLVEDEPAILKLTTIMLQRQGYTVLSAATPGEAIRLAREHGGEIHLLMTDVVMPEMNGRDLSKSLTSLYPHLKHLFMSGYTANVIAHQGVLDRDVDFIQKPFSMKDMAVRVRQALEGKQAKLHSADNPAAGAAGSAAQSPLGLVARQEEKS